MTNNTIPPVGYRQGRIYEANGVQYWHTGTTYWVALEKNGHEIDLREIDGFKQSEAARLAEQYVGFTSDEWESEIANADAVRAAIEVVAQAKETLYWNSVARFLAANHKKLELRAAAGDALLAAGFNNESVRTLLSPNDH